MTRAEEIKLLQSLKGDTYFGHLFGPDQIDAMCHNIENDYPIELGVELFTGSDVAKDNVRLRDRIAGMKKTDVIAATTLLRKAVEHMDESLDLVAESLIGRKNCLRIKLNENIALTEDDREELIRIIDQTL